MRNRKPALLKVDHFQELMHPLRYPIKKHLSTAHRKPALHTPTIVQQQGMDVLELTFLGTSSGAPSTSRNQQALAVKLPGHVWLFDCGEATQHRMMQTTLAPPNIKRIFVSHMHGDHVFGLPGLLCNIATSYGGGAEARSDHSASAAAAEIDAAADVVVVGPHGLRAWLRA